MKGAEFKLFCEGLITLYPTWFRWKVYVSGAGTFSDILYIPHGSDERVCEDCRKRRKLGFISHMVQMKATLARGYSNAQLALYPTWFRWKLARRACNQCCNSFISHMVQMKVNEAFIIQILPPPLYPTWFRWKLILLIMLLITVLLYIPHGSDES